MPVKQKHQPRKHSRNFLKVYAPYLPLFLVLGFGLFVSFGSNFKQPNSHVLSFASDINKSSLIKETNDERSSADLQPLTQNSSLTKAAQAKADDMVKRDYWAHETPDGKEPWAFIDKTGYIYYKSAENLAYGFNTSSATVAGWMNSPQHRANILDPALADVGFGIANSSNFQNQGPETIVVAMYGQPAPNEAALSVKPASDTSGSEAKISYIQAITDGRAPWSGFAAGALIGGMLVYLLITHAAGLRRMLRISERFIIKHPILDMTLIALIALAAVLSQTAGFIY